MAQKQGNFIKKRFASHYEKLDLIQKMRKNINSNAVKSHFH